ncbi:MAG: nitroreductase [Rhodospirillales bacterium]|nr:nitroreductase [Alphaproteobacteria bacterium]MCB9987696.1 nitroreductase [Rhodospirillales bacterium]USO08007.1 MAG: nitroreductase [Rhodospirillales bacterium]
MTADRTPDLTPDLIVARKNPDLIHTLLHRRSASAKAMGDPGPTPAEIETILACAARTPDHGKLAPWWFVTFTGETRAAFGEVLAAAWLRRNPDATPERLDDERKRLTRAPLVVAIISAPRESGVPVWEQVLSAGAACQNMLLAANALGYGANWLTQWYAYDDTVRAALELRPHENIAGFVYIGTPLADPIERDRPDPAGLTNHDFRHAHNRGDDRAKPGMGLDYKNFAHAQT